MRDNYYNTPSSGNNKNRYRSRFFRQSIREHWPYGRVPRRRRLNDTFSSMNYHSKYHECECCSRWKYDPDYYPRHLEQFYPDDEYVKFYQTGLTPAYQMLRLDTDQFTFFVEKSKLEQALSSASGFIDKSNIPLRIELEDPVSRQACRDKPKVQSDVDARVTYEDSESQQGTFYNASVGKTSEVNQEDSDDSDTTVYYHEAYPRKVVQIPECSSSRNDSREEHSRDSWGDDDKDFSRTWKGQEPYLQTGKYPTKMSNSTWRFSDSHNAEPRAPGYFTKEYQAYLDRHSVKEDSQGGVQTGPNYTNLCNATNEQARFPDVINPCDSSFVRGHSYNAHINTWFHNGDQQASTLESPMQVTYQQ